MYIIHERTNVITCHQCDCNPLLLNLREFKRWKSRREAELQNEEERKLKDEHAKMKSKMQSDIDLVKRKLDEEKREQKRKTERDMADNNRV